MQTGFETTERCEYVDYLMDKTQNESCQIGIKK